MLFESAVSKGEEKIRRILFFVGYKYIKGRLRNGTRLTIAT